VNYDEKRVNLITDELNSSVENPGVLYFTYLSNNNTSHFKSGPCGGWTPFLTVLSSAGCLAGGAPSCVGAAIGWGILWDNGCLSGGNSTHQ